MGNFKDSFSKVIIRLSDGIVPSRKKIFLSIISAFLALVILTTTTFCWYSLQTAKGNFKGKLETDRGLRVDDLGESPSAIADRSCLLPASSVDGRNLFFPSDGSDFSSSTTAITYRSANAGDKNFSYLQYDFELMAEANYTSIYIDLSKTHIMFKGYDYKGEDSALIEKADAMTKLSGAIRSALFYDGIEDNKPILFNSLGKTKATQAVSQVDTADGTCTQTARQVSSPFRDYTYGKKQLAILNQGEKRRFSLIVWLEGTDDECDNDLIEYNGTPNKLDLSIGFTTSWDNKAKIIFKSADSPNDRPDVYDILEEHPSYTLQLVYNDPVHKIDNVKFPMYYYDTDTRGNHQWYCNIPDNANHDLSFIITDGDGNTVTESVGGTNVKCEWTQTMEDKSTKNRGDSTVYINDGYRNGSGGITARGHWSDGDYEDNGEGQDNGGVIGIIDDDW
jgi:hypothetical protein